jgi:hypothetical protein
MGGLEEGSSAKAPDKKAKQTRQKTHVVAPHELFIHGWVQHSVRVHSYGCAGLGWRCPNVEGGARPRVCAQQSVYIVRRPARHGLSAAHAHELARPSRVAALGLQ